MVSGMAKKTHLYQYHKKYGFLTEFAGFEMPLWYEGIIPEHLAVRNSVGIFDVTHMGRSVIEGPDAVEFLNYVLARDVSRVEIMQGKYTVMLNENGGIIDDLTFFRLDTNKYLLVYNASNREKDYNWLVKHSANFDVKINDVSDQVVMLAIQGPNAVDVIQSIADRNVKNIKRYWVGYAYVADQYVLLTRTGYTGEDGFEIYLWDTPLSMSKKALSFWEAILETGKEFGIKPCGLGARDTLRLEAGMCLYGHDITEEITPYEAKLDFTVNIDKDNFIGKDALLKQLDVGLDKVRVGIKLIDRGIPREGYRIYHDDLEVGYVTSGGYSPILKCGIAMGYVNIEYSDVNTEVAIDIRGKKARGTIVNIPFYDTKRYGWRREVK